MTATPLDAPVALELQRVSHAFGGLRVLKAVDLQLVGGSITALIGPNGSGKTTLFNIVSGFIRPDEGTVRLNGKDVGSLTVPQRSALGIMRTFQAPQLFSDLTVLENVALGLYKRLNSGFATNLLHPVRGRRELKGAKQLARELLSEHDMAQLAYRRASELPAGMQRNVELIRAAISEPSVLLLDEPSSGLTPEEIAEFIKAVQRLNEAGTTILLVSHDMHLVGELASFGYVLNFGEIIASGQPRVLQQDDRVREVYLGTGRGAASNR